MRYIRFVLIILGITACNVACGYVYFFPLPDPPPLVGSIADPFDDTRTDKQSDEMLFQWFRGYIKSASFQYPRLPYFSINKYYRHNKKWDTVLTLPALMPPWTGKPIERTLLIRSQ